MNEFHEQINPPEFPSEYCYRCGKEIFDYEEIENQECKECTDIERREMKEYKKFLKTSNKEGVKNGKLKKGSCPSYL